jgi:hypothetical protein
MVLGTAGENPGSCKDGDRTVQGMCANIVEIASPDKFTGLYDYEAAGQYYTANNRLRFDYTLYCRWVEPKPKLPVKEFC